MTPFIISFSVGFSSIYIIGFTIIYFCFKNRIVKVQELELKSEQKSKLENEYQITANKPSDLEANNKKLDLIPREEKKEERKEVKQVDNSYKLINKFTDHEAHIGGLVKSEEVNLRQIDDKFNENNTL